MRGTMARLSRVNGPEASAHGAGVGQGGGHANVDSLDSAHVGVTQHQGAAVEGFAPADQLAPVPREGYGRAQTHRIAMGMSDQYAFGPGFDGRHSQVVNRPEVAGGQAVQVPFGGTRPALFRRPPQITPIGRAHSLCESDE